MRKPISLINKFFLLLFGLAICFIMLTLLEIGLRKQEKYTQKIVPYYSPNNAIYDKFGIFCSGPGTHQALRKRPDGSILYNIEYTIDNYGRRITPENNLDNRTNYMAFFGGSFTFGEGVDNSATLPARTAAITSNYAPYNYGFYGFGPFDVLALLETREFQEIKENQGIVIYVFLNRHIKRVYSPLSIFSWHHKHQYYEMLPNKTLVRRGRVENALPFRTSLFKFFSKIQLLKSLNIDIPLRPSRKDFLKLCIAIKEMQFLSEQKFPNSTFYVLLYPEKGKCAQSLIPFFEKNEIKYFDYTHLFDSYPDKEKFYLDVTDHHPSSLAYRLVAEALAHDLKAE